jgi:hypothetical protein
MGEYHLAHLSLPEFEYESKSRMLQTWHLPHASQNSKKRRIAVLHVCASCAKHLSQIDRTEVRGLADTFGE